MDFLGIGVPELVVVIILALVFIGPRDMPKMAARAAKFLRDLRMMSEGFTNEWQREINASTRVEGLQELKEELEAAKNSIRTMGTEITSLGGALDVVDKKPVGNTTNAPHPVAKEKPLQPAPSAIAQTTTQSSKSASPEAPDPATISIEESPTRDE